MISDRLKQVLLNELQLRDFEFHEDTLASQVPGWDSLKHISVIAAVETEFNVRFKTLEMIRLKNIGELQNLVERKLNG